MATSRLYMRSAMQAFTSYLALTTLFASTANGFFPTSWRQRRFGNDGTSHEAMTDQMYDDLVEIYFPEITVRSNSMTRARKTITKANIAVDDDLPNLTAAHFDGENFAGGQERLTTLFQEIIDNLDNDDAEAAQEALGGAMHTLQDFYSHSNWIELGNSSPHPQLGRTGNPTLNNAAGALERTCNACIVVDPEDDDVCQDCSNNTAGFSRLTSGFYFGQDLPAGGAAILPQKCHHGGVTDNPRGAVMGFLFGPPRPGINKDSNNCQYSPHFPLHAEAARVALEASKQYVNDLADVLDEVKLKQLFGIGPTLALSVDTTGSMADIIASVRAQCLNIVSERLGTADEPTSYVLSPFNDPGIGPLTVTSDLVEFQAAINGLFASGGGDCPERSVAGMIAAVEALDGGSLFMFTDAAANDEGRLSELITKANAKDISIYIFKFDSGCDGASLRMAKRDDGTDMLIKRADPASDRVYGQITLATGGQYRSLPRSDVALVSGLIDTLSTSNNRYILKIESVFGRSGTVNATVQHTFPVNGRMSRLTISVSGLGLSTRVLTPTGALDLSSPSVTRSVLSDGEVIIVQNPAAGLWTVILSGRDEYSIDVTGADPLSFSSFDVVQVCGRDGHRGYCPITGPPAYDHDVGAVAVVEPTFNTAIFELRSPAGVILQTLPMEAGDGTFGEPPSNSFFGIFRLPNAPFYVYVRGADTDGTNYQRLISSLVVPFASGVNDTGLEDVFTEVDGEEPEPSGSSSSTASCVRTPGVAPGVAPCPGSTTPPTSTPPPMPSSSSTSSRRSTPGVVPGVAPGGPTTLDTVVSSTRTPGALV